LAFMEKFEFKVGFSLSAAFEETNANRS
jgi:hypothetical protein